jgi:glutamate synthase domain-containing protein 2
LTNAREIQIKMAQGAKPEEAVNYLVKKVVPWLPKQKFNTVCRVDFTTP